jgi:hypothetical protein
MGDAGELAGSAALAIDATRALLTANTDLLRRVSCAEGMLGKPYPWQKMTGAAAETGVERVPPLALLVPQPLSA